MRKWCGENEAQCAKFQQPNSPVSSASTVKIAQRELVAVTSHGRATALPGAFPVPRLFEHLMMKMRNVWDGGQGRIAARG